MELVCPAGSLPAAKAAVDNGADAIYLGFNDATNARHFAGLNFAATQAEQAIRYARARQVKVYLALNTYALPLTTAHWFGAVDRAAGLGVNAIIAADLGVLAYAADTQPQLPRHLSVQASATNPHALRFYQQQVGIRRAVLPRVLSLKQVQQVAAESSVELEVFGFGSLCIMVEGRCHLSSYCTGQSPNTAGVCSPAKYVQWQQHGSVLQARLNDVLIDEYGDGEHAGYPTLCKGRFNVDGKLSHALEEPTSLNTLALLPQLHACGIRAIKIEGRQRSPSYVAQVARVWRQAIDAVVADAAHYRHHPAQAQWQQQLAQLAEGAQTTLGAYERGWR
jgi:putative protease